MLKKLKYLLSVIVLFLGIPGLLNAVDDARLLRFPDINNNLVAFVYAGDMCPTTH